MKSFYSVLAWAPGGFFFFQNSDSDVSPGYRSDQEWKIKLLGATPQQLPSNLAEITPAVEKRLVQF